MQEWGAYATVFLGAGVGGVLRHAMNQLVRSIGWPFPVATLCVNVLGCFAMGLLVGYFALQGQASQNVRLFLAVGVLGGFTTFSTFSLDFLTLWRSGQMPWAAGYAALSLVGALVAVFVGLAVAHRLWPG